MLTPAAFAIAEPLQWLAAGGGPANVRATTRLATSGLGGGMRDRRVLSRSGSFVAETFLPAPDHRLGLAGGLHDLSRAATIGGQKDDLCPPNVLLRAVAIGDHGLKLVTVGSTQVNVRSLVHPTDGSVKNLSHIHHATASVLVSCC